MQWGLKDEIKENCLYFGRPNARRRAERDARIFIRIIEDVVESGLGPSWVPGYPLDGREHGLTDGIKFMCTNSPSPDQNHHWKTRIPWNSVYDSFEIVFTGNKDVLERLRTEVLVKYNKYRSSGQYPLIRTCGNDYIG